MASLSMEPFALFVTLVTMLSLYSRNGIEMNAFTRSPRLLLKCFLTFTRCVKFLTVSLQNRQRTWHEEDLQHSLSSLTRI